MTSPPDKRFKEGLEHYEKTAPPAAWDRIAANLDQPGKSNFRKRLLIRLLVTVMAIVLTALWFQMGQETALPEHEKATVPARIEPSVPAEQTSPQKPVKEVEPEKETPLPHEQKPEPELTPPAKPVEKTKRPDMAAAEKKPEEMLDVNEEKNEEEVIAIAESINTVPAFNAALSEPIEEPKAGQSITYSVEDVQNRFLKKDFPEEATPENKPTSGIQKVIDFAFQRDRDESVFGELRARKNEFLRIDLSSRDLATNE